MLDIVESTENLIRFLKCSKNWKTIYREVYLSYILYQETIVLYNIDGTDYNGINGVTQTLQKNDTKQIIFNSIHHIDTIQNVN